jgi:plasmid stabilization system protein ParE
MGLIREPKDIDFSKKSTAWTEKELSDFREIMQELKKKNKERSQKRSRKVHAKI